MYKVDKERLLRSWKGILEASGPGLNPIKDEKRKLITAIMLENQAKYLRGNVDEAGTSWGNDSLNTTQGYSQSGVFHNIAIPMVRRTFPELIAHEIVGVQPLTGPVGIAFALRFRAPGTYSGATNTEIGHNTIDSSYSGSYVTSAGEALGSKAPTTGGVGDDIGLGIGDGTHISEISMTIEKDKVEAKTRKLRSRWSLEVAQDLQTMHGLDLEQEMTDILSYEITAEIDRELISTIKTVSITVSSGWDYDDSDDADGRWQAEKYRNLYNHLIVKSNQIAITTRRGSGNWVVASPKVCAAFETLPNFSIWPISTDVNTAITGVSKLGSMDGRMMLYRDTFASVDEFIVGYKGPSEYDTGVIYLPYIQLMASRATFEDSFNPALGLMSRYAIHQHIFGASNYYRHVRVHNLP